MIDRDRNLELAVPIGSLEEYTLWTTRIPMLSAEEERDLAIRLRDSNDLDAARRLILSHLRFVVRVARGYEGYGLPQADLIQEGNIGLMKAVKRYNPELNVRLVSFAVHWIRAEIHEFVLRNWRIVKVATTKAQRKLFFNLRSAKQHIGWLSRDEVHAVAKDLGVSPQTVVEMESRLGGYDTPLGNESEQDEEGPRPPIAYLADQRADPAEQLEHNDWDAHYTEKLQQAMAGLDTRSRDIVARRWLAEQKSTLYELANEYQVSAERIRQLEQNAMKKLRVALEA